MPQSSRSNHSFDQAPGTYQLRVDATTIQDNAGNSGDTAKIASFTISAPPTPGITFTQTNGSTTVTEAGNTDTYTLVLRTQPTTDVTVNLAVDIELDHPFFGADNNGDGIADKIIYQYDFADKDNDASDRGDTINDFEVGKDNIVLTQLLDSLVSGGYNGTDAIADGYVKIVQSTEVNKFGVQIDSDGPSGGDIFRQFITLNVAGSGNLNTPKNFTF